MVAFGGFVFQKLLKNSLFGLEFCVVQQDAFYPHGGYERVNFHKNWRLYIFGRPLRDGKSQLIYNCLRIGTFQPKLDKVFFNQQSQTLYDVMQNEIENLEFVLGVNFEFMYSLKNGQNTC